MREVGVLSRGGFYETSWEADSSRRGGGGWDEGRGRLVLLRRPRPALPVHHTSHEGRRKRPLPYRYEAFLICVRGVIHPQSLLYKGRRATSMSDTMSSKQNPF